MIRAGDTVYHRPSRETWWVAAVNGAELMPGGWPETIAKVADCELLEVCTDAEHVEATAKARHVPFPDMRGSWARDHTCPVCSLEVPVG